MVEHLDHHGDVVGKFLDDEDFQAALYGELTRVVHQDTQPSP